MSQQTYQEDGQHFESIIQSLKDLSYEELLALPQQEQIINDALSECSTIEIIKQFYEIDKAIQVTVVHFLWLKEPNELSLIEGMHNILIPLPHKNSSMIYSGHCKSEFFYALPNGIITDDIFERNDIAEDSIVEEANWFGITGLSDAEERSIPQQMRYEYGDLLIDEDGLKAHDLKYQGCFKVNSKTFKMLELSSKKQPNTIHIWHYYDEHYAYAYHNENNELQFDLGRNCPIDLLQKFKII